MINILIRYSTFINKKKVLYKKVAENWIFCLLLLIFKFNFLMIIVYKTYI